MKKLTIYFVLFTLCLASCKKIISIDTENADPQLVIEGIINNQLMDQEIKISKTIGYTEENVFPKISGATVTVTDSKGNTFVFKEGTKQGTYVSRMKGEPGVTYNLNATVEGQNYTASSKMPNVVKMDSIGIINNTFFGRERKTAAVFFKDPVNEVNFYHFNLYVNDVLSRRYYASNDRLTNGNDLRIQLFFKPNNDHDSDELNTNDKVRVEMECVDSNIFNYWYALSQQADRGPNQGTTPANPTSNLSNNALGYFSANTYQVLTATVK
ncbi:DUF4249 domain-containing protein [Pedobacter sp. MR2016-19]|uniref:DUF4249 domain-containing protein n=1 Tax=Pedobacter sp. MR2016-19 TaxID=2780089 RepID=UPI00187537D1|nr:DUF4249 domain-containing protein [Pedobacter sp. MR2016-19]MBE5321872.1 DUF4249 domain-containing protein [Pedobacter sp. MR2016-19]